MLKDRRVDVVRLHRRERFSWSGTIPDPPAPVSRAPGDDATIDDFIADILRDDGPLEPEELAAIVADKNGDLTPGVDTVWSHEVVLEHVDDLLRAGRFVRVGSAIVRFR